MTQELAVEDLVEQPIEVVWSLLTNSRFFNDLRLPGVYGPFDPATAQAGTEIETMSAFGGPIGRRFVVDWDPPLHFLFGPSPSDYSFDWRLEARPNCTHVTYRSHFRLTLWERLFKAEEMHRTHERLAFATMEALKGACARLAAGGDHGLTCSPWAPLRCDYIQLK